MKLTKNQMRSTFPAWRNFKTGKTHRKYAWQKWNKETDFWVQDKEKGRENFKKALVTSSGVVRWKSNGSVPPADCLGDWYDLGLLTDRELEASTVMREAETAKFLEEYRRQAANRKQSAEERFELRANYEPGTTVVDVITGQRWKV